MLVLGGAWNSGPLQTPLLMDFLDTPEKLARRITHLPMGRFGEAVEQAKAVLFRALPPTHAHLNQIGRAHV